MQKIYLILKYLGLSVLLSLLFASGSPFIGFLIAIFVLAGLIYHYVKAADGIVPIADLVVIAIGISVPNIVLFTFFPHHAGFGYLSLANKIVASAISVGLNIAIVYGLAQLSKSIQADAPASDES